VSEIVRCHSDFRYADRPVSFQWESDEYKITRIIAESKIEGGLLFTVVTETDKAFKLHYDERQGQWRINPL
jgi:hypothetical protein